MSKETLYKKACRLAPTLYKKSIRKDNEPCINHARRVVRILEDVARDEDKVIMDILKTDGEVVKAAALLHDVVEDGGVISNRIKDDFGEKVHYLVDALTKREDEKEDIGRYNARIIQCGELAVLIRTADLLDSLRNSLCLDIKKAYRLCYILETFFYQAVVRYGCSVFGELIKEGVDRFKQERESELHILKDRLDIEINEFDRKWV